MFLGGARLTMIATYTCEFARRAARSSFEVVKDGSVPRYKHDSCIRLGFTFPARNSFAGRIFDSMFSSPLCLPHIEVDSVSIAMLKISYFVLSKDRATFQTAPCTLFRIASAPSLY